MIVTRLAGGLGNQMFHYATARGFQRSASEPIVLDTRLLRPLETDIDRIVQRPFALDVFPQLAARPLDARGRRMLDGDGLVGRVRRKLFRRQATWVVQQGMHDVSPLRPATRHVVLEGDFQSERYFAGLRDALRREFAFPALDAANAALERRILAAPDAISVHVRRGDYLSASNRAIYDALTPAYYAGALESIRTRAGPARALFVFSDDAAWAAANLPLGDAAATFVTGNGGGDSWKDMRLMTACRHHVIANSSFSWWGAWLAAREGIRTAPRHWFNPGTLVFDIASIVPQGWQVIDYPAAGTSNRTSA